jgi:hypothetical protein
MVPRKFPNIGKNIGQKQHQKTIHETTLGVYGFSMVRKNQIINIGYHDICEFCEFHEIFERQIGDSVGLRKFFSDVPIPSLGKNRKNQRFFISSSMFPTWWLIPLSKWVITPVINGISRVSPLRVGVITHLLSGMSHQVGLL